MLKTAAFILPLALIGFIMIPSNDSVKNFGKPISSETTLWHFPYQWDQFSHYWLEAFLHYDQGEGTFYGTSLGRLFCFEPDSWEAQVLKTNASLFVKDWLGNIAQNYFPIFV